MTTESEVVEVVREQAQKMFDMDLSPPVEKPKDINAGFCEYFAKQVYLQLDEPADVQILKTGMMNANHVWIKHNGTHYDSEAVTGVSDWVELPYWERVEPHSEVDPTELPASS